MPSKSAKKWILAAIKLAIVAVLVWAVRATLVKAFDELEKHTWHVHPLWLVVSGVLYLAGTLPSAIYGQRLLVGAGQEVGLFEAVRAFFVSQLGKYVPGKAMVLVLRAGMLYSHRVSTSVVAGSVFCETLTTMAVGSLLATIILSLWHQVKVTLPMAGGIDVNLAIVAFGMLLATGLPTAPPVMRTLVRVVGFSRIDLSAVAKLSLVPYRTIALGWMIVGCGWTLQGLSLWATLRGLGVLETGPLVDWSLHTAAVALAVVAGFLALIPGGLGVRELVLIPLLAGPYGDDMALVSAIILRLVWLVAEVVISTILYPLKRQAGASDAARSSGADNVDLSEQRQPTT